MMCVQRIVDCLRMLFRVSNRLNRESRRIWTFGRFTSVSADNIELPRSICRTVSTRVRYASRVWKPERSQGIVKQKYR